MSAAGYVYILTNPALPGLLKIGKTTRTPALRAEELSKPTGVPRPFEVAYALYVLDCHRVEKRTHQQLAQVRVRGREFFELPLDAAVAAVDRVGAPYLPTATRARQQLRRILGDTLGDLISGVAALVWYLTRVTLGLLTGVALGVGGLAAKLLLVSALLLWCVHSPPGCLQNFDMPDTTRARSQSRKQCQTPKCRAQVRKERLRARRKARRAAQHEEGGDSVP